MDNFVTMNNFVAMNNFATMNNLTTMNSLILNSDGANHNKISCRVKRVL